MKCELCGKKLHIEAWAATNGTLYYCDNYKCPKSPKFRKYLLGEWEPESIYWIGVDRGAIAYYWEPSYNVKIVTDPGTLI